jgi:hypothetical protein
MGLRLPAPLSDVFLPVQLWFFHDHNVVQDARGGPLFSMAFFVTPVSLDAGCLIAIFNHYVIQTSS